MTDMVLTLGLSFAFVVLAMLSGKVLAHYHVTKPSISIITSLFLYVVSPLLAWYFFFRKYNYPIRSIFGKINFRILTFFIVINVLVVVALLYQQKAAEMFLIEAFLGLVEYKIKIDVLPLLEAVVLAPIVEEFLFRAVGQTFLAKKLPFPLALLITSLTFGSIHAGFYGAFFTSLLSGYMYHRTKSLTNSIILHASNNLLAHSVNIIPTFFITTTSFIGRFIPRVPFLAKSPWEFLFDILK